MAVDSTTRRTSANTNSNGISDMPDGITLNAATYTKILDTDERRVFLCIDNDDNNQGVYIRLKPASDAVVPGNPGMFLPKKGIRPPIILTGEAMYHGEVSAISVAGTPIVTVTQF